MDTSFWITLLMYIQSKDASSIIENNSNSNSRQKDKLCFLHKSRIHPSIYKESTQENKKKNRFTKAQNSK